jgi:hypothetical protein
LAQSVPEARQGLGEPQPQGAHILAPCLNPPHAPKALQSSLMSVVGQFILEAHPPFVLGYAGFCWKSWRVDGMSWAGKYVEKLLQGESVQIRPRGNSMSGKIESGQLVTVVPLFDREPRVGDIVLCEVNGAQYLHLVKAISGDRFQIGNNRGRINGWTSRRNIFGICIEVSN